MLPPVDHLVYAVRDLASGVAEVERALGVKPAAGGKHVGRGTHNALLSLGGRSYIEIIAPDPEQSTTSIPLPFGLDHLKEPLLATWAMAVTDIEQTVARANTNGYDPGPVLVMNRVTPDGAELRWRLAYRPDPPGGGVVPFLIEWETEAHPALTSPEGCRLISLDAEHPHPDEVAGYLAALGLRLPVSEAARPALVATIEGPNGTVILS